ncbi:conserved hypothetical protein [Cupriavidus phytorum]|uniref:DUF2817 domain-containing protein n=2 Tax=Cupriavidus TaxID=106589 RepID=A0A375C8I5_9BURK|nr:MULTISPECIES: M14 family metallopeptidase [Cupriavidus]PZX33973.1 uncharacterized protein DUF2817 [Cupriavidus alkaliphilus]SOY65520.1 conserved hypothetical protein [Cupriavidus taiwanensis]
MHPSALFSQTYAEARSKFLYAARDAGLRVESTVHPLRGRHGEALAVDVARHGRGDASRLLIVSSGCHGVEGFAGSGVQAGLLLDGSFHRQASAADVAVLYVHALNPWGFSWWRRWTEDNIDLNRNFRDFDAPAPANPGYAQLAQALVPETWPSAEADQVLWDYVAAHGMRAIETAVAAGQYSHPDGLFFGGDAPTWSHRALLEILRQHATQCRELAWLDLHTATGAQAQATPVLMSPDEPDALARARAWWGSGVTQLEDGNGPMVPRLGTLAVGVRPAFAQAAYTNLVLEFGTETGEEVLNALRAAQWLDRQPDPDAAVRAAIDRRIRDAFYTDTDAWKRATLAQGLDAACRAVAGLAGGMSVRRAVPGLP